MTEPLRAIEPQSPTWRAIRRHVEARIEELRTQLEQPIDETTTAMLRGRIQELRDLIEPVERGPVEQGNRIGAPVY